MNYRNIARDILKDTIKSVVYIDENAREFNQNESELTGANEEKLSIDLYTNFKNSGVSLETIKYELKDETRDGWLHYCLENRDLILLDWHLDGSSGELESLKILDKIINKPNLHFCVIYTSETKLDNVVKTIVANYSNLSLDDHHKLKEQAEILFEDISDFSSFHSIHLKKGNPNIGQEISALMKQHKEEIKAFRNHSSVENDLCAISQISAVNIGEFYSELEHPLPCPSFINLEKHFLEIKNTVIAVFNKRVNEPESLLENFFNHIIDDIDSYNKLLTIDFFNSIFKIGILNKDNEINFSKEAMLNHRKRLSEDGMEGYYEEFVKELLFEKMSLSLRNSSSPLLSNAIYKELYVEGKEVKPQDSHNMNVFYNSFKIDKNNKLINFGDVFKFDQEDKYLICLTPLCDCLRPQEKIKRNYFFAEGEHIKLNEALKLGDTAFISFLPNGKVVRWTDVPHEQSKYVPIYIKPVQYKVLERKDFIDEDGIIELHYLNKEGKPKSKKVKYITTIRQNYAQRISNHAFTYPLRVGVDFVRT